MLLYNCIKKNYSFMICPAEPTRLYVFMVIYGASMHYFLWYGITGVYHSVWKSFHSYIIFALTLNNTKSWPLSLLCSLLFIRLGLIYGLLLDHGVYLIKCMFLSYPLFHVCMLMLVDLIFSVCLRNLSSPAGVLLLFSALFIFEYI